MVLLKHPACFWDISLLTWPVGKACPRFYTCWVCPTQGSSRAQEVKPGTSCCGSQKQSCAEGVAAEGAEATGEKVLGSNTSQLSKVQAKELRGAPVVVLGRWFAGRRREMGPESTLLPPFT